MFAGIDIASERHVLGRLGSSGKAIWRPMVFGEDQDGYRRLAEALGPPPPDELVRLQRGAPQARVAADLAGQPRR